MGIIQVLEIYWKGTRIALEGYSPGTRRALG